MNPSADIVQIRLKNLEKHLELENPVLVSTVQTFRELDRVAYSLGLLPPNQSFATQIPWWPLISILGTFSAGKSTFINDYLGYKLQRTGNQAVDDRFSVICYSRDSTPHTLPGVALDQDPRFPFYQISKSIDQVEAGEGKRIDAYIQLKTCPSQRLLGKILIDSPGFDADAQRTSTLRITDHIIHLSDLVLVFFDARHPEPGAMHDTLQHLVAETIHRADSGKFLYILNQIDTTAREDNPEDVVAAWQRALGEKGLTAGRFYTIYNSAASVPIENEAVRQRFESKRDLDLADIQDRLQQVGIDRSYRIVGALEKTARDIETKAIPFLNGILKRWRWRVLAIDAILFSLLALLLFGLTIGLGYWQEDLSLSIPWLETLWTHHGVLSTVLLGLVLGMLFGVHHGVRALMAKHLLPTVCAEAEQLAIQGDLVRAFKRSTSGWRSMFARRPVGWGNSAKRALYKIIQDSDTYVQGLNDTFANPSGEDPVLKVKTAQVDDTDGLATAA